MAKSFNALPRGLSVNPAPLARRPSPVIRAKGILDDPRTSGGWELLSGIPNWKNANSIWQRYYAPELETMYQTQVVVYACVKKICLSASEAPLLIGRETDDGWEDEKNHPMLRVIRAPNPWMSYGEFVWHYLSHKLLTGKSYVWKWRNGIGAVAELWPVPTSLIEEMRTQEGRVGGYKLWMGPKQESKFIPPEDMFFSSYPDPSNLTRGLGPLQAAIREVQTDGERQDYFVEMLTNARTPGMVLYQPETWSPEQKDEVRHVILDGLGRGRRGKPIFMEGEGARIEQTVPLKDLDWPGLTTLGETRICAAFGVPPIIIGLRAGLENGTYSNYEQALQSFYQGTMVPEWALLDGAFTRGLLRDEGELDLEASHDISKIRGLQEDEDKRADRANKLFTGGICKRNEARKIMGLDPLEPEEGGDDILQPMSMTTLSDEAEAPPTDTGAPEQIDGEPAPAAPDDGKPEPGASNASPATVA